MDAQGNLYGTAQRSVNGTVFETSPNGDGTWTTRVLCDFLGPDDGRYPDAALILDGQGNLYGTTSMDGHGGAGTVFELTPNGDGTWTEKNLHFFTGRPDGGHPQGRLLFDAAGNLYGTTPGGGSYHAGIVFELVPNGDGTWTEKILHTFRGGAYGAYPLGGLIFDS